MEITFNEQGPEALFSQADSLIESGNAVKAAGLLSSIIKEHPDYGRAYNHLGYLWETKFRDFDKAEDHYKSCLKLCPEYPAIYYNYAVLLSTLKRYDELVDLLNRALEVPGITQGKIHNEFGIMYEAQGKYSNAIESYQKAFQSSFSPNEMRTFRASIQRIQKKMLYMSA